MLDSDKKIVVGYIIDHVFLPLVINELTAFLTEYKKQVIFAHDYEVMTGYAITMPTVTLDLRKPAETLQAQILIALNESNKPETK